MTDFPNADRNQMTEGAQAELARSLFTALGREVESPALYQHEETQILTTVAQVKGLPWHGRIVEMNVANPLPDLNVIPVTGTANPKSPLRSDIAAEFGDDVQKVNWLRLMGHVLMGINRMTMKHTHTHVRGDNLEYPQENL